jgi:hypothetical protein
MRRDFSISRLNSNQKNVHYQTDKLDIKKNVPNQKICEVDFGNIHLLLSSCISPK